MKTAESGQAVDPGRKQEAPGELPGQMNRGMRRAVKAAINALMHILFNMDYVNKDKLLEHGPVLMISNHTNFLDIPALHVNFDPWVYFVAKEELFKGWFGSRFLPWWGAIPINRQKTTLSSAREILRRLRDGKHVSIFPEGTRVPQGADHHDYLPKPGVIHFAQKSKAMIQPVAIQGNYRFRGRITVTVGDPFRYEDLVEGPDGTRTDRQIVIEMMRRVYQLNGVDYLPGE